MSRLFDEPRLCTVYQILNIGDPMDENSYVGSTIMRMKQRMFTHKSYCNNGKVKKLYNYIRNNGDWENFTYEILESKIINSLEEQLQLEQSWIDMVEPTLNERLAYVTPEQVKQQKSDYYQANKEYLTIKKKEYAERNKEHLSIKKKEYAKRNREHLTNYHREWSAKNKEHLKEYKKKWSEANKPTKEKSKANYQANKEIKKARARAHYHANKEKVKARHSIKVVCECGKSMNKGSLTTHKKSQSHKDKMNL